MVFSSLNFEQVVKLGLLKYLVYFTYFFFTFRRLGADTFTLPGMFLDKSVSFKNKTKHKTAEYLHTQYGQPYLTDTYPLPSEQRH